MQASLPEKAASSKPSVLANHFRSLDEAFVYSDAVGIRILYPDQTNAVLEHPHSDLPAGNFARHVSGGGYKGYAIEPPEFPRDPHERLNWENPDA